MKARHHLATNRFAVIMTLAIALTSLACAGEAKDQPVRFYVLVGQSNMQGKGEIEGEGSNTLRHLVQNDPTKEYQFLLKDDGQWVEREDVWIYLDQAPRESRYSGLMPGYGSSGGQVGPEIGFGHKIGDANEGQVLVIKACWGGKSLGHNFLPPSIGKYPRPLTPCSATIGSSV